MRRVVWREARAGTGTSPVSVTAGLRQRTGTHWAGTPTLPFTSSMTLGAQAGQAVREGTGGEHPPGCAQPRAHTQPTCGPEALDPHSWLPCQARGFTFLCLSFNEGKTKQLPNRANESQSPGSNRHSCSSPAQGLGYVQNLFPSTSSAIKWG